jgi:translin
MQSGTYCGETTMSESNSMPLGDAVSVAIDRMTATSAVRDDVLVQGRQAIRHSANSVRALHRGEFDLAAELLTEARHIIDEVRSRTADFPQIYQAGYVQDAMKEYAEAAITRSILQREPIPSTDDLGIEDAAWLNALAEAGSELRRNVLDNLRQGNQEEATRLLEQMDDIYGALVTVDFPDAITGGLRRTTDQFRAVLERTRGDLTVTSQQRRLQDAIESLQAELRARAVPE